MELSKRGGLRFDLRDPYYLAVSLSWPSFALAFVGLELAINVGFALLYLARPGSIANASSFADAFFFSIETLATVGYGVMSPASLYGHIVSAIEIVSGMAFTAITTGLLFVRFSKARPRILYANRAVVAMFDGHPTLMLRMANGRTSLLTAVSVRLGIMLTERSGQEQFFRRVHDLRLVRSELPIFALTWTLMHKIDENSPLYGYDAEQLAQDDARLFLMIDARDPTLNARIQDMKAYGAADIAFGTRFADTISIDADGRTSADLTRLHLTEPDE
jgi:inward rectifier potassium channel